jgi:hypothetical protein
MRRQAFVLLVVIAALATAACGSSSSPVAPSTQTQTIPPPPGPPGPPPFPGSLTGVWSGHFLASECRSNGCDSPRTIPFVLRLLESGAGYEGVLETNRPDYYDLSMSITGVVQPDGAVLFTGHRSGIESDRFVWDLTRLLVRLDGSTGLSGDIDLRRSHPSAGRESLEGKVRSASYQSLAALQALGVSGRWSGVAVMTSCSGYCPSYQQVGDDMEIAFALGASGSAVSGSAMVADSIGCPSCWIAVAGSTSGTSLTLASIDTTAKVRLLGFEGALDRFGRIKGTFRYRIEDTVYRPERKVTQVFDARIRWLKRDQ